MVMVRLSHRPRKTLNYKTPHAVFFSDYWNCTSKLNPPFFLVVLGCFFLLLSMLGGVER